MSSPSSHQVTSAATPDIAEVRAWMQKMIDALRFAELITAVLALIVRMRDLNLALTQQLTDLRRARPRSETLARLERQLTLPLEGLVTPPAKPKPQAPPPEKKPKGRRRGHHPGRAPLPTHLPRVELLNAVPEAQRACPQCGLTMTTVGHEVCERLEVEPARIYVLRRKDERLACPHDDVIVSAKAPPQLVPRGKLGDTLIVEALSDKYVAYQPIERQCRRYAHAGVDIASQTLGRSVACAIDLLSPIARAIRARTRACAMLATDATGLPVLDQDCPQGIRNGTMWCWVGDHAWVSFFYAARGDAKSVQDFLGRDLCRTVQCDGTSITTFLEREGGKRPGCWSHARRRFVEAARSGDALALVPLRMIRRLFAIERLSALCAETPEARMRRRQQHSARVLEPLRAWLTEQRGFIPPKTPLGKALGYLHRQWPRLVLFLDDGHIELTNNRVERELRALVLGRKNWLFATGDLGGERTATILTIVGTCVAHRINPRAYLHAVTKLIVHGFPNARLGELLPDRIASLHPELRLPAPISRPPGLPAPA